MIKMKIQNNYIRQMKTSGVLVLIILLGFTRLAFAELRKVEQTVYGMDCVPCAYGLEKSLKKIGGVEDVKVSLNDGKAIISLKPGNTVTLEQIQDIVRKNGFTPKEANVTQAESGSQNAER